MTIQNHYFLAVPLPQSLKDEFSTYMKELKKTFPFTKWVHSDDLHLTLAFLGYIKEEDKLTLNEAMKEVTQNHSPFSLTLEGLSSFGNSQSPKIFWQGVKDSEELAQLRSHVYDICEEVGFQLDRRPFNPHITLARKWKGAQSLNEELLKKASVKTNEFEVHEVVFYETHLNKLPKYEAIEIFPLL